MSDRPLRVLYLHFGSPAAYPPVVNGAHILANRGADIWILGTNPPHTRRISFLPHARIRLILLTAAEGIRTKIAFAWFVLAALWLSLRVRPHWLYVSDVFATPAGLAAARIFRVPVLYHEHDVHTESSPSWFVRLCLWARRRLARSARHVVVPSTGRAMHLRQTLGISNVDVVFNCVPMADVRAAAPSTRETLELGYQGSVVPQRLPLAVAEAVARLSDRVHLTIAGYEPTGAQGHAKALIDKAAACGARDAVRHVGVLTRAELLEFTTGIDVGLALVPIVGGDVNMATMAGASNKAFEYLACGIPLIVSDVQDWRSMFVEPGYALAVNPDDPCSLERALRWFLAHRDTAREMGEAGRRRVIDEWNYERQFAHLCAAMFAIQRAVA